MPTAAHGEPQARYSPAPAIESSAHRRARKERSEARRVLWLYKTRARRPSLSEAQRAKKLLEQHHSAKASISRRDPMWASGSWACKVCDFKVPNSLYYCGRCGGSWQEQPGSQTRKARSKSRRDKKSKATQPAQTDATRKGKGDGKAPTFQVPQEAKAVPSASPFLASLPATFGNEAKTTAFQALGGVSKSAPDTSSVPTYSMTNGTPGVSTPASLAPDLPHACGSQAPLAPRELVDFANF